MEMPCLSYMRFKLWVWFSFIPDFRVFENTCTDSGFQEHYNDLKSLCNVFVFDVLQIVQFQKRVVMPRLLQG